MNKSVIWLVGIGIVVLYAVMVFNGIVKARNNVKRTWGDVESTYQRRADLVPNLVKVVKNYSEYEQETFLKVTEARNKVSKLEVDPDALNDETLKKFQAAQAELQKSMGSAIDVVVERYPDLKANENFLRLQDELSATENRINVARKRYNEAVNTYNYKIERFPGMIFAGFMNLEPKPMFEAVDEAETVPDVNEYL